MQPDEEHIFVWPRVVQKVDISRVEIDAPFVRSSQVDGASRIDRDSPTGVVSSTAERFGPMEITGRIEFHHINIAAAGCRLRSYFGTWVEIYCACKVTRGINVTCGVNSKPQDVYI